MRGIVAVGVAIGVLWSVDFLLNNGRYGEAVEKVIAALIGM
jgi:hypothetical protein